MGHVADARVGITAVNPAPVLVKGATELLTGKIIDEALAEAVGDLAAKTAKPLTTSALTPEYRREMIRVFTKRAVLAAAATDFSVFLASISRAGRARLKPCPSQTDVANSMRCDTL